MKASLLPALWMLLLVPWVRADEPVAKAVGRSESVAPTRFFAGLSLEERAAVGLEKLSPEQKTALDALVVKEMKLARQGDVRGFTGTFTSRRSETERASAGLAALTTSDQYQLDRVVSRALATLPPGAPVALTRAPRERELVVTPFKWETHGFVQLEYGFGSGGRDYRAATVAVTQENPRTGTAITFAYTVAEGDGLWCGRGYGFDGYHYGYRDYGWRRPHW